MGAGVHYFDGGCADSLKAGAGSVGAGGGSADALPE